MNEFSFPTINTIDDVLPSIEGSPEFYVNEQELYTTIMYRYVTPSTFTNDTMLECRGIKFSPEGEILARPLHKFFNMGEKINFLEIDWDQPYRFTEKLDGTMVHTIILNDTLHLMTKAGYTPHAVHAEGWMTSNMCDFCHQMEEDGYTAIFEFTSPNNRIVVPYATTGLTLLAIRNKRTGEYLDITQPHLLQDVNVVDTKYPPLSGIDARSLYAMEGIEGFVLEFPQTGQRIKLKTTEYVNLHNNLANVDKERTILKWYLEGTIDDVIPELPDYTLPKLNEKLEVLRNNHRIIVQYLKDLLEFNKTHTLSRKDFNNTINRIGGPLQGLLVSAAFMTYDGVSPEEAYRSLTSLGLSSNTKAAPHFHKLEPIPKPTLVEESS